MTITIEGYLSRALTYIEDLFDLPYNLKLKTSGDMKVEVIDPQSQHIIKVIDLDKDHMTKLFDDLKLSKIDHILIDTIMDNIEDNEYDDLYYSAHRKHQALSDYSDQDTFENNSQRDTKSSFEVADHKVIYGGESYPILQHISEVKNTSNGELFNRFFNRNQFFKWIKENSNKDDAESATFGEALWAVVNCDQKSSSECWFIEVYSLDKITDLDWAISEVEDEAAFFLADSKGNIYLVNTNID